MLRAEMTVHILRGGVALCGFSSKVPGAWPVGHTWARDTDRARVTCDACRLFSRDGPPDRTHDEDREALRVVAEIAARQAETLDAIAVALGYQGEPSPPRLIALAVKAGAAVRAQMWMLKGSA